MKVLIVLTSHSELGNTGEKTGFWIEEFASPYYVLADAGISAEETFFIDDASPNIETAAAMGFKTHLLLPGERIEKLNWNG